MSVAADVDVIVVECRRCSVFWNFRLLLFLVGGKVVDVRAVGSALLSWSTAVIDCFHDNNDR